MAGIPQESADAVAHKVAVRSAWEIMCSVGRHIFKKGVKQPNNYLYQLVFISPAGNRNLNSRHLRQVHFSFMQNKS